MVWSNEHKIIFVHIPKTGGTSIEKALKLTSRENGYGVNKEKKAVQHYDYNEYRYSLGAEKFDKYYKFTISRNPYEKVISEFFWLKFKAKLNEDNFQKKTFDEYLDYCKHIVNNKLYKLSIFHDHFKPQHEFIYNNKDKLMINKILRFENFKYIKKFILLKFKKNLQHDNNNNKKEKIILTDEQKEKIYQIYHKDFILLKYDK